MTSLLTSTPGTSAETMLFTDPRCGFSFAVPGHPSLHEADSAAGVPPHQARVVAGDLGVELRYRLDDGPYVPNRPEIIAAAFAEAYAKDRSAAPVNVQPADPRRLGAWGGAAWVTYLYPLRAPDGGLDVEEIFVGLREAAGAPGGWIVYLSKRFAARKVHPVDWQTFTTAVTGSLRWDPSGAERAVPVLLPPSAFFEPGLPLRLRKEWADRVDQTAAAIAGNLVPARVRELAQRIGLLAGGGDPPSMPVDAQRREAYRGVIGAEAPNPAVREILLAHAEFATTHDVRGWVYFITAALLQV
jgi:hypothetical protein